MAKLVFEGDIKILETIQKENRLRIKRKGLKVSLTELKQEKVKQIQVNEPENVKPNKAKTSKKK